MTRKYDGRFVPYRKPPSSEAPPPPAGLEETVRMMARLLQVLVVAMDYNPQRGTLSFRDGDGRVWEVTVQASDAPRLRCEVDLEAVTRK